MCKDKSLRIRSLKLNFLLNTTRTALSFLIPLVTFPYVSRVLGPEGIGKVEFANSIVSYFVLLTGLGIPIYGSREIARQRDNLETRSRVVWELTAVLLATSICGYLVYFLLAGIVPAFRRELLLFLIVSPSIFLSDFSYEWVYQGLEDQVYITARYILVKILQVAAIFLLVRSRENYHIYAAITVGMNSVSTVFNIVHLRKYISFVPIKSLSVRRHIKPVLFIFASVVATSIYTNLDVTMVGFFCGDEKVGLYTAANRIVRIVISVVTAFSAVVVPRIENSLKNGDTENYRRYINLSLNYILILAVPCCLGVVALADDIILIFAGAEFAPSVLSMRLLSPIIVIVGLAYFVGLQLLYPHREEWKYTVAVSVAAVANALCNFLLIPRFAQNGAIAGTLVAEGTGLLIQIVFARKYIAETELMSLNTLKYILAGLIMFAAVSIVPEFENRILHCALCVILGASVYGAGLLLMKEKLAQEIINKIEKTLLKNKDFI